MTKRAPVTTDYSRTLSALPGLEPTREWELVIKAKAGDKVAARDLVQGNLRHIPAMVARYRSYGFPFDDLIAEGQVGLFMAIRRFDPTRGLRFITYAAFWIRARVTGYIIKHHSLVSTQSGLFHSKHFFSVRREFAKNLARTGDTEESIKLMAAALHVSTKDAEDMLNRAQQRDASFDVPLRFEADGASKTPWIETFQSDTPNPEELLDTARSTRLDRKRVREALATLDERERKIVVAHHMSDPSTTLADLGREMGISRERTRQLEQRGLERMRRFLEGKSTSKEAATSAIRSKSRSGRLSRAA